MYLSIPCTLLDKWLKKINGVSTPVALCPQGQALKMLI